MSLTILAEVQKL